MQTNVRNEAVFEYHELRVHLNHALNAFNAVNVKDQPWVVNRAIGGIEFDVLRAISRVRKYQLLPDDSQYVTEHAQVDDFVAEARERTMHAADAALLIERGDEDVTAVEQYGHVHYHARAVVGLLRVAREKLAAEATQ